MTLPLSVYNYNNRNSGNDDDVDDVGGDDDDHLSVSSPIQCLTKYLVPMFHVVGLCPRGSEVFVISSVYLELAYLLFYHLN